MAQALLEFHNPLSIQFHRSQQNTVAGNDIKQANLSSNDESETEMLTDQERNAIENIVNKEGEKKKGIEKNGNSEPSVATSTQNNNSLATEGKISSTSENISGTKKAENTINNQLTKTSEINNQKDAISSTKPINGKDYVEGMWLMMQQDEADDFVLATGETHSVKKFCELSFGQLGIQLKWEGEGVNERGVNVATGKSIIEVDPRYFRPTEVDLLIGDPSKAHDKLGWKHKHSLEELVTDMVQSDLALFKRDRYLLDGGHKVMRYHE